MVHNPLGMSPLLLYTTTAAIIIIQTPTAFGWIPRTILTSSSGVRNLSDVGSRRRVLLSASNKVNNNSSKNIDDESDDARGDNKKGHDEGDSRLPLFAEGDRRLRASVLRLEAIFNDVEMDTDYFIDDSNKSNNNGKSLLDGERVVLGGWMDWDEGPCKGDSCGDESDVSLIFCNAYDVLYHVVIVWYWFVLLKIPFTHPVLSLHIFSR